MSKPSVYLAGPITGQTFAGATDWRDYVRVQLPAEIDVRNPMRCKVARLKQAKSIGDPLTRAMGITTRDRCDVMQASMVLVNVLGASKASIGTVMEIAWADLLRIPVVLVMEPEGNPHEHAMLTSCVGWRVESLDEAVRILKAVLILEVDDGGSGIQGA